MTTNADPAVWKFWQVTALSWTFFGGGGKISLGAAPLSPSMEPLLLEICVGVTQRSLKMAHLGTVSNSHSIVTMALSFIFYSSSIVSKIKRNISRKSRFFHTLHSTPLSGASPLIRFCTENVRLPDGKKSLMICSAVSMQYRRVTDR